jgi:hypothetical protein
MDFSRQCKRFLNHTRFSREHFQRTLANISAISYFRNVTKTSDTAYRLVLADNDLKCLLVLNEASGELVKEVTMDSMVTYGIACTSKPAQNFIYVSDYANNVIRKFDENLRELKKFGVESTEETPNLTDLDGNEFFLRLLNLTFWP